ncbi:hypothetical protein HDV01_006166 [Terramyces sp. JEL0728]|nr:hypothetical protein HDV01_006166 [Terramyces sp. JEL0728]
MNDFNFSTLAIHADKSSAADISAPLHVSTTYKYPEGTNEIAAQKRGWMDTDFQPTEHHVYSRMSTDTRDRVESVLGALEKGYAVTYSSGLASIFALFQYFQPKRILMNKEGYHGSHNSIKLYTQNRDVQILYLEGGDFLGKLSKGDMIYFDSPQNPRGEVSDLSYFSSKKPEGVILAVDATFAPPPIQYTLEHGADIVMHSSTKSLGGHSDLLGGVLITKDPKVRDELIVQRHFLGSVMGNMEAWLLLRSLRTLKVRVMQQSETAARLAQWLSSKSEPCLDVVGKVWHASLPAHPGHEAAKRQGKGWACVLSVEFKTLHHARLICSNLRLVANATSLGGVESLIEWRTLQDPKISPTLCRVSIGLEDFEDLQADFRSTFLHVEGLLKQ